jgi:hypothetical protein
LCRTRIEGNTILHQVIKRCINGAEISHETSIKSRKSKITPKLCKSCRNQPTFNSFNLRFIHLNPLWSHNIAKKGNLIGAKDALLNVSK